MATLYSCLSVLAFGSKNDNFDKSMCTKAKNPFCVLPLVTQKIPPCSVRYLLALTCASVTWVMKFLAGLVRFLHVCLFGPWILKSSNGSSHLSGI